MRLELYYPNTLYITRLTAAICPPQSRMRRSGLLLSSLLSCSGDIAAINRTPATHKLVTQPSLLLTASQPLIIIISMFPVFLVLQRFSWTKDAWYSRTKDAWFSRSLLLVACHCWLQRLPCPAQAASISVASTPPPLMAGGCCDHQYPIMCSGGGGRPLSISNQ